MSKAKFRVGIIGADTQASWAGASHIPALKSQPSLELGAVATRRDESARAAAETFGAEQWFSDPYAMINDDAIDIVTVAVKVPAHKDLVLAALQAGKAVYSEAPLGATLTETEEMAAAAGSLHTAIGLQGRHNPAIRRASELVAAGKLGRLMSARVTATTFGYGPESIKAYDYFNKAAFGATFMTITTGHVLDVIEAVLGNITEVDARTELLWPEIEIVDTGETSIRDIPDHLDLIAKTTSGAPVSVQVLSGVPADKANFTFAIRGSNGWLTLTGNHPAGVQVGDLSLSADIDFETPDAPLATGVGRTAAEFWTGASINVGALWHAIWRQEPTRRRDLLTPFTTVVWSQPLSMPR